MATYKIHPGIGIARLGNSDTEFYLAPETPAGLPMECDSNGNQGFGPDGMPEVVFTEAAEASDAPSIADLKQFLYALTVACSLDVPLQPLLTALEPGP